MGDDIYRHIADMDTPMTKEECLLEYRKVQIPPLPAISNPLNSISMELLEKYAKKNRGLFSGMQKIMRYLALSSECNKKDLYNIIAETFDQNS